MTDQFIYFADPMCSWCWGFSPVIDVIQERYGTRMPVRLVLGGLFPGTSRPLDENTKKSIRDHWEHVHAASGQPFDFAFFAREGFVYDTEPPSRAVVTVRHLAPEAALGFLKTVHHAFYAENKDVTRRDILRDLAVRSTGLDAEAFTRTFDAEETVVETRKDFAIARQADITGFPSLIAGSNATGYRVISYGYQPWQKIEALITAWFEAKRRQHRGLGQHDDDPVQ